MKNPYFQKEVARHSKQRKQNRMKEKNSERLVTVPISTVHTNGEDINPSESHVNVLKILIKK